ncbi:sigma-70 family RNA polymerase sigma factor [Rapidithrix thailandica]|uniref:Sigma-70 family RNA polymerase sigma factor n=1 Tax=Rapidithrix thailandica TaxID=413964 RepID=A0AAW9SGT4_9BACT
MNQTNTIAIYQTELQAIAVKMLGSIVDAEDMVQEAFLKWLTTDHSKIHNPKSYLVRIVTNNCLNFLNSAHRKKIDFFDTLSALDLHFQQYAKEPEVTKIDRENEISVALAVIHKKLPPLEKAIYLLREIFEFDYEDLQDLFDKKKDHCRQLFCRAKEKLNQEKKKLSLPLPKQHQLMKNFSLACNLGHLSDFINELSLEVRVSLA